MNGIDLENVIDEVESVGRSQVLACQSVLAQALLHLVKLQGWPASEAIRHWRAETAGFLANARRSFAPSMRRHIAVQSLYDDVLTQIRLDEIDDAPAGPLPDSCPFTLDDLLAPHPDPVALAVRLTTVPTPPS